MDSKMINLMSEIDKFTYLISYLSGEVQQYIEDWK